MYIIIQLSKLATIFSGNFQADPWAVNSPKGWLATQHALQYIIHYTPIKHTETAKWSESRLHWLKLKDLQKYQRHRVNFAVGKFSRVK